jgi:membrane-bound ClpP family serine protease
MKKTATKKTTKKTVQPEFIMNCVDNTTPAQLYNEVVNAKVRAGKPITTEELELAKEHAVNDSIDLIATAAVDTFMSMPHKEIEINGDEKLIFDSKGHFKVKKPNIFKRFWNWIRRK